MQISKFQFGNPIIQGHHQQRSKIQAWGNRGIQQVGMLARQAEEQITQRRKADAKANKKTKAPMKPNNTAILLDALWQIGAFKGIKDRKGRESTYNTAVDGISGRMTKTAMDNARKMGYIINNDGSLSKMSDITGDMVKTAKAPKKVETKLKVKLDKPTIVTSGGAYMPSQVIERATESIGNNYTLLNAVDFMAHNPGGILIEDIIRANANRASNKLFGIRPFKGRTITSLPTLQMDELKRQVQFARSKGKNWFDAQMYKQMYGYEYASKNGANGEDRSGFWNRMKNPSGRLEHTLGAYGFYEDENGNIIIPEVYDFNVNQHQGGHNRYAVTRNFAGEFASKSTDPNEGKIKYNINLGKL